MVAGIGCRAGVSGAQVEAAIAAALAALRGKTAVVAGLQGLTAIATPAAKSNEPGIRAAAVARGLPLLSISQPELEAANPDTVTRSAHSLAAMNVHSVAEAAALAGARATTTAPGPANPTPRLLQPRVSVGPVTCALADTTLP